MPFTFSHPAIVLPLTLLSKRWYSLTGLVVGSMIPDAEYFLRMRVKSIYSHTLPGLFYFDIPFGLIMCFIFHGVFRNALISNLPLFLKKRLITFTSFEWTTHFRKTWLVVCCSLFIGAASHIFWDGFTHADGHFVAMIPTLQKSISVFGYDIPLYKLIQHSSSIIGALIVFAAIIQLPTANIPATRKISAYWFKVLAICAVITFLKIIGAHNSIGDIIVSGISGTILGLILVPIIYPKYKMGI